MKVIPVGSYILLKKYKKAEEKKLILIANEVDEFPHQGVILESGSDCKQVWLKGDRVKFMPYSEQRIDDESFLVKEETIIAKIEEAK